MKHRMRLWLTALLCCLTMAVSVLDVPVVAWAADDAAVQTTVTDGTDTTETTGTDTGTTTGTTTGTDTGTTTGTTTGTGSAATTTTTTTTTKTSKYYVDCDKYIGLSSDYWVMATAKKTVYVYSKATMVNNTVMGHFTYNNCIRVNTTGMKKGTKYLWLKVYMQNGKTGYIFAWQVSLGALNVKNFGITSTTKKNKTRIKVCQFGLKYMGTKFILGGSSLTKGIDCSTFARTAFRKCGVKVSKYAKARTLARTGKAISRSQLKPGDMIFYPKSSTNGTIVHCAIYLGNGYLINASGHQGHVYPSGGIRISRIDYRTPTASKFRNIIGN